MKSAIRAALLAGFALAPAALAAQGIERGAPQPLGAGTVQAFAETDSAGRATRIGIAMTEDALASLAHEMVFVTVPLPRAARDAGYDHVSLDWMPHGHEPEGLFGAPHFDVHFYITSEAERLAIDPADPAYMKKAGNRPDAAFMPAGYAPPPEVSPVPAMGEHWLDTADPVLSGQPFEAILIYGAWDGEMTFVEPMVTRDLLASKRDFGGELAQPARTASAVSLPGAWSVSFDPDAAAHVVSIDALTPRVPGNGDGRRAALAR